MIKSKIENRKLKIHWLLIYLLAIAIIFFLLFYRPAYYKPRLVTGNKQLSAYLTHQLIPQFYNGLQLQQPFDLVVTQEGINDIVAHLPLPEESRRVNLTSPTVNFDPGRIIIAATANVHGAKLIITLEVAPAFDANGLLNVNMDKVKIGAVNITPAARIIGRRMYADRFDTGHIDPNDVRMLLAASFLNGRPFDPVFFIDGKKIRLDKIAITTGQIILHFVPVPEITNAAVLRY